MYYGIPVEPPLPWSTRPFQSRGRRNYFNFEKEISQALGNDNGGFSELSEQVKN